ncbi:MAG: hypothetical protein AAF497_07030 [Planctomycetota bacterium]
MSRRVPKPESAVTLFPFLAVLICTMGSLIVLLVIVVQQAKAPTEAPPLETPPLITATPTPESTPDAETVSKKVHDELLERKYQLETQLQDIEWATEQIVASRETTRQRLETSRLALSRMEDQSRTLSSQLELLEKQANDLLNAEDGKSAVDSTANAELSELKRKIEQAKLKVVEAQELAKKRQRQFSLIPYDGPYGTNRRPIYIECLPNRIIMQPEGIEFFAADFQVDGPENPLAAALRAAREYFINSGLTKAVGEPYPLLVVRPGGARSFSICRVVLREWEDEFGYELVPEEIELAYPKVDAALASTMMDAVQFARTTYVPEALYAKQQKELQQRGYAIGKTPGSGITPLNGQSPADNGFGGFAPNAKGTDGGFAADGNTAAGDSRGYGAAGKPNGTGLGGTAIANGSGVAGGSGFGSGNSRGGEFGTVGSEGYAIGGSADGAGFGGQGEAGNAAGPGNGIGPGNGLANGQTNGGFGQGGSGNATRPNAYGSGYAANNGSTGIYGNGVTNGSAPGQSGSGSGQTANGGNNNQGGNVYSGGNIYSGGGVAQANGGQRSANSSTPGGGQGGTSPSYSPGASGGTSAGGSGSSAGGSQMAGGSAGASGGSTGGSAGSSVASGSQSQSQTLGLMPQPTMTANVRPRRSIAEAQGENWAIPNAANGAIGVTRPIQLSCGNAKLDILPEPGTNQSSKTIGFNRDVKQAIQPLVNSIWDTIDSWGIAGPGVFWRPVLQIKVEPGADRQYEEMAALLEDSGLIIQRR